MHIKGNFQLITRAQDCLSSLICIVTGVKIDANWLLLSMTKREQLHDGGENTKG